VPDRPTAGALMVSTLLGFVLHSQPQE